jgi:hypothetical protein
VTTYRYLTAAQWGGTWDGTPRTEAMPDGETYVHHVGGSAWMGDDAVRVFQQLNAYAKDVKGYQFLDYDILVHYSRGTDVCTIAEGRGRFRSAATLDRNEEGEAVCVCGNFALREPVAAEIEGTARAIKWGIDKGWMTRSTLILGHRDNPAHPNATACPGNGLYFKLPTIRSRVAYLLNPPIVPPKDETVNWNPSAAAIASVKSPPPTAETLASKWNDWAVISLIKSLEEEYGLPVTGRYSQALVDRMLKTLA